MNLRSIRRMSRPRCIVVVTIAAGVTGLITAGAPGASRCPDVPESVRLAATPAAPVIGIPAAIERPDDERRREASSFFADLVHRYQRIESYEDVAVLRQVTTHPGAEPSAVETRISCAVRDNQLTVETPGSALRRAMGLRVPLRTTNAGERLRDDYRSWLAPHMVLRFSDTPLDALPPTRQDFTPTDAAAVTIDNKAMVHLELRSGDGVSEDCPSRIDVFVNRESMLIERIQGEQSLPGGGNRRTTLDITPIHVQDVALTPPDVQPPDADVVAETNVAADAVETIGAPVNTTISERLVTPPSGVTTTDPVTRPATDDAPTRATEAAPDGPATVMPPNASRPPA
jgi:hypothetical protein